MSSVAFNVYPLKDKEFDDFRNGTLELRCVSMKLEQQGTDRPEIYSGPGYIRQNNLEGFHFVLFAQEIVSESSSIEKLMRSMSIPSGQIIPESELFALTAKDDKGRVWETKDILISVNSHNGTVTVCTGVIEEITTRLSPRGKNSREGMLMCIFDEFKLPYNTKTITRIRAGKKRSFSGTLNALSFTALGNSFFMQNQEKTLLVQASSTPDTQLPPYFETRILETLQFLLAQPLDWSFLVKHKKEEVTCSLRSRKRKNPKSRIHSPVEINFAEEKAFCKLFRKYLQHIIKFEGPNLHPLSAQMRAICYASASFINTEALILSVAVESIVKDMEETDSKLSDEDKKWIGKAREYFNTWNGHHEISNRITGLFGMINNNSVSGRLDMLAKAKAITAQQKSSWSRLRNAAAHGDSLSSVPLQELLLLCNEVLVLFYHIVFYQIRYSGEYLNYAKLGWPKEEYIHPRIKLTRKHEDLTESPD